MYLIKTNKYNALLICFMLAPPFLFFISPSKHHLCIMITAYVMNYVCVMNNCLYTDVILICVYKPKDTLGFNVLSLSCFLPTPHCIQDMSFASR